MKNKYHIDTATFNMAGIFTLSLRVVAGWTYFSAFWRRLILEYKLDPEGAGYIGEKFNHFLPNALGIRSGIEYLVQHDELLWWFMLVFTLIEGVVGLLFMLGLFTRSMGIAVLGLALGILLGAGWLGTTCLDEWQIGILGVAAGFTIFLTGGGRYSLDGLWASKCSRLTRYKWFGYLCSGSLPITTKMMEKLVLFGSLTIIALCLFTNQYFHGGVWGTLHNLSVRPHITISNSNLSTEGLSFTVFRDEGADVYGSFLIKIRLKDELGKVVLEQTPTNLSKLNTGSIHNYHVAKVKPGKHSLVIPLGAKAKLTFEDGALKNLIKDKQYEIELTDVSGLIWTSKVRYL